MSRKLSVGGVEIEFKAQTPNKGSQLAFRHRHGGSEAQVVISQPGKESLYVTTDSKGGKSAFLPDGAFNVSITTLVKGVAHGDPLQKQLTVNGARRHLSIVDAILADAAPLKVAAPSGILAPVPDEVQATS